MNMNISDQTILFKRVLKRINNILMMIDPNMPPSVIKTSDDNDLQYYHSSLHGMWEKLSKNKKIEKWDKNKIRNLHTAIVKELFSRGINHTYISDLDDTLVGDLKKRTTGQSEETKPTQESN